MLKTKFWIYLVALLLVPAGLFSQGSENVELLLNVNDYPNVGYNDCWGYTSPDGREYALLGTEAGTSIIDITDTEAAYEVDYISGPNSTWKDIKTYMHYAYVVTESSGGMQILDLSDLPNSVSLATTYNGLNASHNIYIDTESGILYAEGDGSDAVVIFDLADPLNPEELAGFGFECHDVFTQDGILYVSQGNQGTIGVYDVSDPADPTLITNINVPASGYVHNAWATEDGNYIVTTEETSGKTVKMWDVSDLGNVEQTDTYLAPDGLAHNAHNKNGYSFISHYGDGLRIVNIEDPNNIFEEGYYDTYPGPGGGFQGAWGAFPFFNSGKILISDQSTGLYVVYFAGAVGADATDPNPVTGLAAYSDYQTPNSIDLTWTNPETYFGGEPLVDFSVDVFRNENLVVSLGGSEESYTDAGLNDGEEYEYTVYVRDINDSLSLEAVAIATSGGSPVPDSPSGLEFTNHTSFATLSWTDPTTQDDGTPLDDLDFINIYRNDEVVATVEPGVSTYDDYPTPGFGYTYRVTAVDNEDPANESASSNELTRFVGDTPEIMIWVGPNAAGESAQSADSIFEAIAQTGQSVFLTDNLFEFGESLPDFQALFVILGIYPNNHVLENNGAEAGSIEAYLNSGGRLYLEGGDCYEYDPTIGGHEIRPWFGLGDGSDGSDDVSGVDGENELDGFSFGYEGENSFMDELEPNSGTSVIWRNDSNNDISGVYYQNTNNNSLAIGIVPSFGGLAAIPAAQPSMKTLNEMSREELVLVARVQPKPIQKRYSSQPELRNKSKNNFYTVDKDGGIVFNVESESELMQAYLLLFGIGGEFPSIQLSSESVEFGGVTVNEDSSIALTITNSGLADLVIDDITSNSAAFSVDETSLTIPGAGGSAELMITFAPTAVQNYSATLTIHSNDPFFSEADVDLFGNGVQSVGILDDRLPKEFALRDNYPNPFNPSTTISIELPRTAVIQLEVYNTLGQKIRTLVSEQRTAGYHQVVWDARNDSQELVGSGVFFYRLEVDGQQISMKKMVLLK